MATKVRTRTGRRRVQIYCQICGNLFRYMYPGTGPYKSFCKVCRKEEQRP